MAEEREVVAKRGKRPQRAGGRMPVAMREHGPAALKGPPVRPAAWAARTLEIDLARTMKRQILRAVLRIGFFVVLPTLLTALYVFVYASPRYVSEFQILYRSNEPGQSSSSSSLSSFLGSSTTPDMTRVIETLLTSDTMALELDRRIGLRKMLSDKRIDWWNRMPVNASKEKFLAYFRNRVSVYEQNGGFLLVDVEGFSKEDAQTIAQTMIDISDATVTEMTDRPRQDMVDYTQREMQRYESALRAATAELTAFRNKHYDYDFNTTVTQMGGVVGALQSQLVQARSELANVKTFLGDKAPSVVAINSRIKALEAQLAQEQSRLANPTGPASAAADPAPTAKAGEPYSKLMAEYAALFQTQEFASKSYLASKQAYEAARLDLAKKQGYVVSFIPPARPDDSIEPNPTRLISTAFVTALLSYAIGTLFLGMVRDQLGV